MENEHHVPDVALTEVKKDKGKKDKDHDVDRVKAVWSDENHSIFIRLCLEQVRLGNKPGQTLNKLGYRNLESEFFKETGFPYVKSQFKNHWDSTRRDWIAWNALKKSTEVGWNAKKNTYSQSKQWWADFVKQYHGGDKFAEHPLKHEQELNLLFGGGVAPKDMMVLPISSKQPQEFTAESPIDDVTGNQGRGQTPPQDDDTTSPTDSTRVAVSPISARYSSTPIWLKNHEKMEASPRRCSSCHPRLIRPEKRPKTTLQRCEASMKQVHQLLAQMSQALTPTTNEEPNPILKAMELLNEITEIERNSDEWLFAASLLREQSNRQLFVALGDAVSRSAWIKREYRLANK